MHRKIESCILKWKLNYSSKNVVFLKLHYRMRTRLLSKITNLLTFRGMINVQSIVSSAEECFLRFFSSKPHAVCKQNDFRTEIWRPKSGCGEANNVTGNMRSVFFKASNRMNESRIRTWTRGNQCRGMWMRKRHSRENNCKNKARWTE